MVIQSLSLKNFKAHKDSHFEFAPITSFIGSSNSGKSDTLRALRLVLLNQNWPERWLRRGCNSASISVCLSNGSNICRNRTKSGQSVTIKSNDETFTLDGKKDATSYIEKFTGFNKSLISAVYGEETLNFISQDDPVFLISKGTTLVQRRVCGIFGLNRIEDTKLKLISENKKLTTEYNSSLSRLNGLVPVFKRLDDTFNASNNFFNDAKNYEKLYQNLVSKSDKLKNIRDNHQKILLQLNTLPSSKSIHQLLQDTVKLRSDVIKLDSHTSLLTRYRYLRSKISASQLEVILQGIFDAKDLASQLELKLGLISTIKLIHENKKLISRLDVEEKKIKLAEAKEQLQTRLKEEGKCPVCLQPTQTLFI